MEPANGALFITALVSTSPSGFQQIVGKRPWRVWRGVGSFLIFEFGRARKNEDGTKRGTYTLWIYMASWAAYKARRELAHSESPDKAIHRAADALTGKSLEAVVLNTVVLKNKVRYGATFHFEGGFRLQVSMYDRGNHETIFMLYTPEEVVMYDYDGMIRTEAIEQTE